MEKIELLAPVGSMESLYAAINCGADAIYLGGQKFSARAKAVVFDNEKMKVAVDYCHTYNVKIYVTMNTILKDSELKDALKYVGYLYEIGVDALIIQDLGLLKLIKENYSDFEVHASTQMTVHNGEGALYYRDKGFKRIVLSRELNLKEIEYISRDLGIETEIFVHGALCVSYSGQCLMSAMIGGRSGNRGKCAQPCRQEYKIQSSSGKEMKGHLLSTKDTCTIDNIKEIIDSKAMSLKIEGRMKKPEYVAGVVKTYRKALDKELLGKEFNKEAGKTTLMQLFNRGGFSNAYLIKDSGRDMMSFSIPKNTGILIGRVEKDKSILLKEKVSLGDGFGYRNNGGVINKIILEGKEVKEGEVGDRVSIYPSTFKSGDLLYKTSSIELNESLNSEIKPYLRKLPLIIEVSFKVGEKLSLSTCYNKINYEILGEEVQLAKTKSVERNRVTESLKKSGDTAFDISEVIFRDFEDGFIPMSSLNGLRRQLLEKVQKGILSTGRRNREKAPKNYGYIVPKENNNMDLLVTCCRVEQLKTLISLGIKNIGVDMFYRGADSIKIKDIESIENTNIFILTPEIIKSEFSTVVEKIYKVRNHISGVITGNGGIIKEFKDKTTLIGDYKLNVFNKEAFSFYREDLNNISLSLELSKGEIKELLKGNSSGSIYQLYGKTELMVSEYCPIGSTFGGKTKDKGCTVPCKNEKFSLVDERNISFNVMTDMFCRSHILNNVPLNLIGEREELKRMGIETFRIDFKDEGYDEIIKVLEMLQDKDKIDNNKYTKGCYRRGVE